MRKAVLGSIAAITAGAGVASAQGFVAPPPLADVQPASGNGPVIPPYLGGDPGVMPVPQSAPNGAPVYPPPGFYGANPGPAPGGDDCPPGRVISPKWWVNTDYLFWFAKAQPVPSPLLTTSARGDGGILGRPSTAILAGGRELGYNTFSGFRINGGYWRGDERRVGFELGGTLLEKRGNYTFVQSDANGLPVIARPFTDATTGLPGRFAVADPNLVRGSALVATTTQTYGVEANTLLNLFRSNPADKGLMSVTAIAGFRYWDINEDLTIASSSTLLGNNSADFAGFRVNAPATIGVTDYFDATNRFYGGQLGLTTEYRYEKLSVSLTGKIAFGIMNQRLDVEGRSELLDPTRALAAVNPGGLFATANTMGRYRNDEFAIMPEGIAKVGYNWSSWLTTYVGYSFIYSSRVIRPGTQFSHTVNPALIPTAPAFGNGGFAATPNTLLTQDEFWMQGVSLGLLVKY